MPYINFLIIVFNLKYKYDEFYFLLYFYQPVTYFFLTLFFISHLLFSTKKKAIKNCDFVFHSDGI